MKSINRAFENDKVVRCHAEKTLLTVGVSLGRALRRVRAWGLWPGGLPVWDSAAFRALVTRSMLEIISTARAECPSRSSVEPDSTETDERKDPKQDHGGPHDHFHVRLLQKVEVL